MFPNQPQLYAQFLCRKFRVQNQKLERHQLNSVGDVPNDNPKSTIRTYQQHNVKFVIRLPQIQQTIINKLPKIDENSPKTIPSNALNIQNYLMQQKQIRNQSQTIQWEKRQTRSRTEYTKSVLRNTTPKKKEVNQKPLISNLTKWSVCSSSDGSEQ